jgi:uncharacterized damage-inducible protein DinB
LRFLEGLKPDDWFRQPPGCVTHIAWQVAHVAMAQYRLALERIRGHRPEDEQLIPEAILKQFGKGSTPEPDPSRNPSVESIRAVFDRVYQQALAETAVIAESDLDNPVLKPHPLIKTKIQSLWYCAHHEMIHAGQIALVRRLLGHAPAW